jgi:hypothetical protein
MIRRCRLFDCAIGRSIIAGRALFALVMALPAAAQDAQEPGVTLRPAWEAGQSALYEFWTQREQVATVNFRGREQQTTTTYASTGETRWTVDRVAPDGSAEATMTLLWIRVVITGNNGREMVNDTRRGSGDIPAYHDLLRSLTEVPLQVRVADDGTIEEVRGVDRIRASYRGEGEFPLTEADFRESATDLAIVPGPPERAKVGDDWKQSFDWNHELGTLGQQVTYRLTGVEDVDGIGLATVTGKGKLRLSVDKSKFGQNAGNVSARLIDGSFETQILYDLQRDEAVGRNSVQNETIELRMSFPQATINRRLVQRIQSQVLRIEEGE